jgi:hypothetical protein
VPVRILTPQMDDDDVLARAHGLLQDPLTMQQLSTDDVAPSPLPGQSPASPASEDGEDEGEEEEKEEDEGEEGAASRPEPQRPRQPSYVSVPWLSH